MKTSKLDKKLREIPITRKATIDSKEITFHHCLSDAEIAQIHKAFADEGYRQINEVLSGALFTGEKAHYMTGKRFYERFEKEFNVKFTGEQTAAMLLAQEMINKAKEAAKRAAGLNDV